MIEVKNVRRSQLDLLDFEYAFGILANINLSLPEHELYMRAVMKRMPQAMEISTSCPAIIVHVPSLNLSRQIDNEIIEYFA